MIRHSSKRRVLGPDSRGSTLVEFAIIAPTLVLMIMGFLDLGHSIYYTSVIQGTLQDAARLATVGDKTQAEIDAFVTARVRSLSSNTNVVITKKSYADYTGVKKPEKIVTDTAPVGTYNAKTATTPGDCHEDVIANRIYDLDRGKTGLGSADDVIFYQIAVTYDRVLPLGGLLGYSRRPTITINTVLKNQPYAAQVRGAEVVCA